ncbi:single-stranded DNA-binding protein [Kitasatospora sp. NPDC096147]|uniref:single-stranded DNA-binding protein n=1 Tax=Kitasatospora sp. NPDC096147 TaxID=3364093 RepID=UPI003824A34C
MNATSHTMLIGRLLQAPKLYVPEGTTMAKATFTLQQQPPIQKAGRPRGQTQSGIALRCVAWRGLARTIVSSLTAGSRVIVVGVLTQRRYTPRNESSRIIVELEVESIGVLLDPDDSGVALRGRGRADGGEGDEGEGT